MAKDIVINYSTGEIIEPRKNLTLGERFFSGGNPLPEDPTKPVNPWAPKPTGPVLPNKMMAAKGGLARRKHVVGLAVPIYTGLAALTGITVTAAKNYLDKNPQIYNKLASNFDGNMEKLKENISKYIPAIHGGEGPMDPPETEFFPDQSEDWSKSFGETERFPIADQKKPEPPVSGGKIDIPLTTGGSEIPETKKEDIIFTSQTAEDVDGEEVISKEEIKETFDKSKILYDQKKMTEVKELTNKEFAEKVANFIDTKHGGRIESAVKDILGVTEKTKDVENLRARINSLFKNREIKRGKRTGNIAPPSNVDITYDEKVTWSDLTTNISKDKNHLRKKIKKFIKEGKLDPNKSYTLQELADAFGVEFKDKSQSNNMGYILGNKLKGEIRTTKTGKYPSYHLGDTLKALQNKFKNKKIAGTKKGGSETYAFNKSFDPELSLEIVNLQDRIANLSKNADIYDDEAIPHWQHAESRANMGKYPNVFKDSNLKTFQTSTLGHPGVNVDIMTKKGFEAKKGSIYKELNKLIGKKANKENIEVWKKLSERMDDVYIDVFKEIEKKKEDPKVGDSYIGAEKTVIPIKISVPEIGEKFRSQNIYGDMSNVEEIMGNIQKINPNAKKLSDLSKEEKDVWRKTVINQYMDHLTDFYKNAGYDEEDLETWQDWIYEGDPSGQTLSLEERQNKAIGGPVVPSIPYREHFAEGSKDDKRTGEEILESIKKQVFELENNWNTEQNVFEKLGDVVDIRNIPYYADRAVKGGVNVAEVSAKLPFVAGELISDLIQKPGFKRVEREKSDDEMTELFMEQTNQDYRLKPTEVWGKAWDNIKPGAWSKKLGLDSLISDEELRMQEQGMSEWPKIAGSNIELGVDVTLPWGYVGAARKAKQLEKVIGKYIVPGAKVDKKINDMLSTQGEGRRDFMKMAGSLGVIGTLKALGLDKLLKGVSRNPVPGSIKMLERSTTKMPVWFPKFIDKVNDRMTYRGDGMWDFKGTDDFLPGFHIERVGDDYYISGKNEYDQDFSITYESPKWEGDADGSYYNKGEFVVEDSVPMRSDPDGNVDFDGEVVEDLHDVLGGTKGMEEIATGEKIDLTRGDQQVIDAELRFQSEADMARDLADE